MGLLGGFVLDLREEQFGHGAQALVIQGRPSVDGAGQVLYFTGRGGKAAGSVAPRGQAHGTAPWLVAQIEGHQPGLTDPVTRPVDARRPVVLCVATVSMMHFVILWLALDVAFVRCGCGSPGLSTAGSRCTVMS